MKPLHAFLSVVAVVVAAVVIAIGCGGSSGGSSTTTTGSTGTTGGGNTASVQMTGAHTFNPVNVTVAAGTTITWTDPDVVNHTVTSDTGVTGFASDTQFPSGLPSGASFSFTVPAGTASGTILYYHCRFHGAAGNGSSIGPGMAGTVTVK